jgi:predicted ATP-dependent serine protease
MKEAVKMGFLRAIISKKSITAMKTKPDIELIGVSSVQELLDVLFA